MTLGFKCYKVRGVICQVSLSFWNDELYWSIKLVKVGVFMSVSVAWMSAIAKHLGVGKARF